MADVVKEIEFRVNANAAPVSNLKREIAGLQSQSKAAGGAMGRMVPKDLGNKLGALNEKTEKGRQLLTTFGGAMGGAAGNAVYYGGTIASVIGKFSLWELGAMAVTAAIAGLAWALSKESAEEVAWKARLEGVVKTTDTLRLSLVNLRYEVEKSAGGWTKYDEKIAEVRIELIKLNLMQVAGQALAVRNAESLTEAHEEEAKLMALKRERIRLEAILTDAIRLKGDAEEEATRKGMEAEFEAGMAALTTSRAKAERARKAEVKDTRPGVVSMAATGLAAWFAAAPAVMQEQLQREAQWEADRIRVHAEAGESLLDMQMENAERREHISKVYNERALEIERKAQEDREVILQASIAATERAGQIIGDVAGAVGASSQQQMRIQAFFQAITDTLNAVHCYATAAEYYAAPFGAGTAQGIAYTIAGTMYAASATLAAAKAGGAFGGVGGGGGGAGRSGGGGGYGDSGRRDYGDSDRGGRVVTINVEGHVLTAGSAAGFIRAALEAAEDRDNPGRTRSEVA